MGEKQSLFASGSLLCARLEDAFRLAQKRRSPQFVGFLNEQERGMAEQFLHRLGENNGGFWGGWKEAERVFFGAFPDFMEEEKEAYPIAALNFSFRKEDSLSHRDFLGALMALGVKRETIGDIVTEPGRAVVFAESSLAPYILEQVSKIGRVGVKASLSEGELALPARVFEEIQGTAASLRLDCVLGLATGLSRGKAAALLASSQVMVNHQTRQDGALPLQEGTVLSVRGFGKFVLSEVGKQTRKGRLSIRMKKYI